MTKTAPTPLSIAYGHTMMEMMWCIHMILYAVGPPSSLVVSLGYSTISNESCTK